MSVTRLIYFSENQIEPSQGSLTAQLSGILSASRRNNQAADITGALVFDDQWFLQALEGERASVWRTLKRIEDDERHSNIVIVDARIVPSRLFANWWMGLAKREKASEPVFRPFLRNGFLDPREMSAESILEVMVSLAEASLSRKVAGNAGC